MRCCRHFSPFYLGEADGLRSDLASRFLNGLGVGAAVSAGFAAVFVATALATSAGLRLLVQYVPWVAVVIGAALVLVGGAMLAGRHLGVGLVERFRPGTERDVGRMVVFGAAYAVASLSCTLAVLLALVAQALATRSPLEMLGIFGAYGAGAGTVLTALTVSAALARGGLVRWLRRLLPVVSRMAGAVLVVSGAYLVAYWLPALSSGSGRGRAAVLIAAGVAARIRTLRGLPDSGGGSQPLDGSLSRASPTETGTRSVVGAVLLMVALCCGVPTLLAGGVLGVIGGFLGNTIVIAGGVALAGAGLVTLLVRRVRGAKSVACRSCRPMPRALMTTRRREPGLSRTNN